MCSDIASKLRYLTIYIVAYKVENNASFVSNLAPLAQTCYYFFAPVTCCAEVWQYRTSSVLPRFSKGQGAISKGQI